MNRLKKLLENLEASLQEHRPGSEEGTDRVSGDSTQSTPVFHGADAPSPPAAASVVSIDRPLELDLDLSSPPPEPAEPPRSRGARLREQLKHPESVRLAFVLKEILDRPVGLRRR